MVDHELALIGRREEKDVGLILREEGGALFQLYVHVLLPSALA